MLKLPTLPNRLVNLSAHLPSLPVSAAFVTMFNLGAWRGLRELDWAPLHGRRFCVHVKNLRLRTFFSVSDNGLRPEMGDHADVTFTATSEDFLRLALRLEDPDTLFFNRRLLIEGNTDLGLTVKNMLDSVELDTLLEAVPVPVAGAMRALRRSLTETPSHDGHRAYSI